MKTTRILFISNVILLTFYNLFCAEINEFNILKNNYRQFKKDHCNTFPTIHKDFDDTNVSCDRFRIQKLFDFAQTSYPIMDDRIKQHYLYFIDFKQKHGSEIEKKLYNNMSLSNFIIRLLEKRPLNFLEYSESCESTRLRNNPTQKNPEMLNFNFIGTHNEKIPLILEDYLSYDEMKIAALIGLSSPTLFLNNGHRSNNGIEDLTNCFQEEGIYTALVGPCLKKCNKMEWQDIIITKEQNTKENGYGLQKCNTGLIQLWSNLYGCKFPTYEEAKNYPKKYIAINHNNQDIYFNIDVYKKRIQFVIKPFLLEANKRGKEQNKKVYVHAVGIGTGAWAIHQQIQEKAIIKVYKNVIKNNELPYISDINFSWFGKAIESFAKPNDSLIWKNSNNNVISIHFSQRNPAKKLTGKDSEKLLAACYPWDSNAYPGNEYWIESLTTSGNSAAACCSYIAILQNILINPYIKENIIKIYG